ncbi:hypothetical protein RJ640_022752 [Escallonia rubra]|uniref:Uncharacterized protein n=1 Tax=Escallonia rubra TaxID=112253 RepID=A0AA88QL67_9ASTE|nr:hypothetical protein RJ640_022752 [Escallonia rubra]
MEVLSDKQSKAPEGVEDVAVNVSEFSRSNGIRVPKAEDPDATECSSSFADTKSGNENCSGLSDAEVESQFYGDNGFASAFDGFNSIFPLRKKKLTSHWRTFIQPLMWRCKWAELRIKEIGSLALKYTRENSAHDRRKQLASEQLTLDGLGSRSLPYTFRSHRKKTLKRRKRKRVEDTTDTKLYMSYHNLFSYSENKRSDPDGTSTADDYGTPAAVAVLTEGNTTGQDEFGTNNDGSFFEDQDNFLEQIFRKIETVHSRVHKLKTQLDLVMSKNAGKFSSSENLSNLVLADALASSVHSPTFSACNGDTISVGGIDVGDLVMPESAVSSFGEAIHIPDIIESTLGLLSHTDVTQHRSQIGDSSEDIGTSALETTKSSNSLILEHSNLQIVDTVMHNQAVKAEPRTLDEIHIQPTWKHQELERSGEEVSNNPLLPAAESEAVVKPAMSQEQSFLKSSLASEVHFPKNKRKRGERKAGTGGWSRQCPGEPDSQ